MDIIDYDWNGLLAEYIPKMLEGASYIDYSLTLLSLARKLDDAHISVGGMPTHDWVPHNISGLTPYVLLENNIGLINPDDRIFSTSNVHRMMETFADTDGIIIDLRQYPSGSLLELIQYFVEESQPYFTVSFPSSSVPSEFFKFSQRYYIGGLTSPYAFFYDRPVVVLMNRSTMSWAETAVMMLRNGRNVTVMGTNSIGGNGNVAVLPLPGGIMMRYTGLGIYTADGGQTHRIGLPPDIRVEPTAKGVAEGRDELMEAAIQFILGS